MGKATPRMSPDSSELALDPPLSEVLELLYEAYGVWETDGDDDILGVLVSTILSQSTNSINSTRAFQGLVDRFEGDWERVRAADVTDVADAIAPGGLSKQKAPRIQAILQRLHEQRGELTLEWLREETPEFARTYLLSMKGVGPKTAAFTLMRAAGMPLFAMDTHILRLCIRLGWTASSMSDTKAHAFMQARIPVGHYDSAHVAMIRHGQKRCFAQNPACAGCPLGHLCPTAPGVMDA
ncbi:MAG: endonuclease III [Myxococcota bacterium]